LYSLCGFAVLLWGCPKRQTTIRVVYVPPPPSAATPSAAESEETLIIEEPTPPEPEPVEVSPAEPAVPRPAPRRRRSIRTELPSTAETGVEPEEVSTEAPSEVPALEPRESAAQQAALRSQIRGLQEQLQQQISHLEHMRLPDGARRTLDDARTFLSQSERALEAGDLQRGLNLAQKASQLVSALEQ